MQIVKNLLKTKAPTPKPNKPELVCKNITINQISRTRFEFNTSYTVNHTTFVGVKYIIKDESGKVVIEKDRKQWFEINS